MTSSWFKRGTIQWEDPNYHEKPYSACEAHAQSRLANVLFTRFDANKNRLCSKTCGDKIWKKK